MLKIIMALMLLSLAAQAEESVKSPDNVQQLGRRPYAAATVKAPETVEGNAAVVEDTAAERNYKKLHLHQLGRRPYAEKTAD